MPSSAAACFSRLGQALARLELWQWIAGCTVVAVVWLNLANWWVVPYGDNAIIEVLSRDVLSRHPPLVNMLSTIAADASVRHPGPLLFDALALPVRMLGDGRGLHVGVALVHAAMVWTAGRTARRFLGADGAAIVASASAVLVWSLGREILAEPWQPHVTLMACVVFLVAAWGLAAGSDRCVPALVFSFSFVVQTHASYIVVAPAVLITAVALRVVSADSTPVRRPPLAVGGVLAVALWAQPVFQQVGGSGRGNLGAIIDAALADDGERVGLSGAITSVSAVLAQPPFWLRPGTFDVAPSDGAARAAPFGPELLPSGLGSVGAGVCLVALVVLIGGLGAAAWRRDDRTFAAGGLLLLVAIGSALAFVTRLPVDLAFGFMVHKVRWLWPLGALTATFFVVALGRRIGPAATAVLARTVAVAAILALLAGVLQGRAAESSLSRIAPLVRLASDSREHLPKLDGLGSIYVPFEHMNAIEAFVQVTLVAELVEQDADVRFTLPLAIAQYGDHYQLEGSASLTMRVQIGPDRGRPTDAIVLVEAVLDLDVREREQFDLDAGGNEPIVALITLEPFSAAESVS